MDPKEQEKMRLMQEMKQKEQNALSVARDARTVDIAAFIIKQIAMNPLLEKSLGSFVKDEDHKAFCKDLQLTLVTEFVNRKVLVVDAAYIFKLAHQAIENVAQMMQINIHENTTRAEKFKWGMTPQEITFDEIHKVLLEADAVATAEAEKVKGAIEGKEGGEKIDTATEEKV